VEKLNPLLLPAGTVTAPAGATLNGSPNPLSHHVTGGDVGAPAPDPKGVAAVAALGAIAGVDAPDR
jgi:hypothetical protein